MDPGRDHLFSPASSSMLTCLLPSLYMHRKEAGWKAFALDVADAF